VVLEPAAHPAVAPGGHAFDQWPQLLAGTRQLIGLRAVVIADSAHDARLGQPLEATGEQRGRDQRQTATQIIEAAAARGQLANDQQGPAFAEYFGRLGERAELTVIV